MSGQVDEVQAKSKEFIDKAKAGNLDEATLKWGLSAGAIVAGVSLLFAYYSFDGGVFGSATTTGLDLLTFRGEISFGHLKAWSIPLTAILGLYLHFGEPSLKWLGMATAPGRAKLVYTIGLVMAVLGVIGCIDFLRIQVRIGSLLGFVGLALLGFVFFKLRGLAPDAPATTETPAAPPTPPPAA